MCCNYKTIITCTVLSRLNPYRACSYFNDKFYIHFGGSLQYWMNVACRQSRDSCILVTHTGLCVDCAVASSWELVWQPEKTEPFRATPFRSHTAVPQLTHAETGHCAVSNSGLGAITKRSIATGYWYNRSPFPYVWFSFYWLRSQPLNYNFTIISHG
jgi:hypothetical protein